MTIIAVIFLHRTFSMLTEQNIAILQTQMKSVLTEVEKDIWESHLIADEMCVDSTLSREKMQDYGTPVLNGIKRIELYSQRMKFYPTIFLTYTDARFITKSATMKGQVFADELSLNKESLSTFNDMIKRTERVASSVLEKRNGGKYLFLLYYYPQSKYIDEKRIGYVFDAGFIEERLEEAVKPLNCTLMLLWENEGLAEFSYQ